MFITFYKFYATDKVRIRRDLEVEERYGDSYFIKNMEQFKRKLVTIINVICADETFYNIKEDNMNFFWTDEMIECKVYDNVDEFWNDWKNKKVGIRFNSDNEFSSFINDYHFKHFNITCPKGDIINFDTLNYIMIYDKNIPDKWNWVNNNDEITDYNVITYDDFIKLVKKYINNVKKIAESTNSPKIDEWDKNVPVENIDGMGTFESEISNKNHILMENKYETQAKLEVRDTFYRIELEALRNVYKLLKSIEVETDLSKIDDTLNIIDKMIDVKNKVLNDFDTDIFNEMD